MNPLTPVLLALATAALLIALGYRLRGAQLPQSPTAAGGGIITSPPAAAWHSRGEAVDQLKALRGELELDGQYGRLEAFLLFDVASYLGFDEAEIQAVVGVGWFCYIGSPADLDLEENA